jgi:hypothetical protein
MCHSGTATSAGRHFTLAEGWQFKFWPFGVPVILRRALSS